MARTKKTRSGQVKKKSSAFLQPASLNKEKLRQLYASMLRCRLLTLRLQGKDLERHKRLGDLPAPQPGAEALIAGILLDLQPHELVAPGRLWLAARLIRGESAKSIIAGVFGVRQSTSRKSDRRVECIVPENFPLTAQISMVLGAAWAFKRRGDHYVAIGLYGDGGAEPNLLRDAVNFSVRHKLGLLHVVEVGNGLPQLGSECPDLPVLTVDGDDAVAVYRVGQEAIRRARQGRGPALVECLTTAPASLGIPGVGFNPPQPSDDPIARLETYLQQRGFWSDRWIRGLMTSFNKELDLAVESAQKLIPRLLPAETEASLFASTG